MSLNHSLRRKIAPAHHLLRKEKVDLFFDVLQPRHTDSFLDLGGGTGIDGEFSSIYTFFAEVTTLNILPPNSHDPRCRFVQGDACCMPFADNSFDWVFSNAVIEHVGDRTIQQRMAAEIRRVSKLGYFVSTPNWWFPLDPHSLVPFYHWLPRSRSVSDPYWMLSVRDMQKFFPEAQTLTSGFGTSVVSLYKRVPEVEVPTVALPS